ncbi:hypothetical protein NLM33_13720 [Bradyrhizobium sp. CCGUVB1N3]|uniref:hypothetical protein n=1 Tax=Bradyrhizobium sp. CCGUVB1N3 TaxID=2949629 RepID=UPI0020B29B17|nr:hypothetical protein [Bradyrhizobium sp. CCGUVB1N3]MCP3471390.1 hypothetical protein [Bradyrhizobium sp. CCGUVB1N3]
MSALISKAAKPESRSFEVNNTLEPYHYIRTLYEFSRPLPLVGANLARIIFAGAMLLTAILIAATSKGPLIRGSPSHSRAGRRSRPQHSALKSLVFSS